MTAPLPIGSQGDDDNIANGHAAAETDDKTPLLTTAEPTVPAAPASRKVPFPQTAQPRFVKLAIPPEFDNCSLVTRLWLQSRLPSEKERREREKRDEKSSKNSSRAASPGAGGDDDKALAVTVASKDAPPVFRTGGRRRPFTVANVWLWLDLARVLTPYLKVTLRHAHPIRLFIYVLKNVMDTLQPTARLYATAQLYDLVEEAIGGKPASWGTALRLGSAGLLIRIADDMMGTFFQRNTDALNNWMTLALERSYLKMQLDTPLQVTDDVQAAQVFEAGVFAGLECAQGYNDGPWGLINGLGGSFAKVVDITAKVAMMYKALVAGDNDQKIKSKHGLGKQAAILMALAFAPTLLQQFRSKIWSYFYRVNAKRYRYEGPDAEELVETFASMATSGTDKQEVLLFGMRDWVLERWEKARLMVTQEQQEQPQNDSAQVWLNRGFGWADDMLRTIFYVLLATRSIDTGLGLGAIHLYQNTASTLVWSFRSLNRDLDQGFQSIFFMAAFAGAIEPVRRGPMIDYDTVRVPGGMRIEAKNLSFTYDGAEEPTLQGINLVVERGETLAIVGYNGGGKSTLVKLLMGLYRADAADQLLLNDIPMPDFDPSTVHKRQSALFQDFARYGFTLKENVGLGDVSKMDDDKAVREAIVAGGAVGVMDKLGLDCPLNPYGEPQTYKARAVNWYQEDAESDSDSDDEEDDEASGSGKAAGSGSGSDSDKDKEKEDGSSEDEGSDTGSGSSSGVDAEGTGASTPKDKKEKRKKYEEMSLSGGQWQRVGLARAFMRAGQADLVVFDEPSAALDPRAEAELFNNIHGLSRAAGSTTIYISHRFNTVRKADKIALIEDGKVAEYGSHKELMGLKGQYYDLFMTQAEGYVGGDE